MTDIVDKLTAEQALLILGRLFQKGGSVREAVVAEATGLLSDIDGDDLAQDVFDELDSIDVQECWDRAGGSDDGDVSPDEAAIEIVEEVLQPFLDQAQRYHELGMPEQEAVYCEGVFAGIYRYERDAKSEFKNLCEDIPADCAGVLFDDWWTRNSDKARRAKMDVFIRKHCPDWASWLDDLE